jgi:hypothetical protein
MAYEPAQDLLGVQNLVIKAVFIRGTIPKDFANVMCVHRSAKETAAHIFPSKPKPENVTILKCIPVYELQGFAVIVTDGSSRSNVNKR